MSTLKNPCRECDHHLAGGDKNVCECTNCEARIAYVNDIGRCPSESVNIELEGRTATKELDKMNNHKTIENQTEDLQSEKDQFIEDWIEQICQDEGVTIEQIRAGIKGAQDKTLRQEFNEVRDRIIKSLASGEFGLLSQKQIGKYLGVSNHVISIRMMKMGISPMHQFGAKRNRKRSFKKNIPDIPTPIQIPPKPKESKIYQNMKLNLDFTDLPEVYDDLQALANQELRTVENQALYILKRLQEQGLKLSEL